MNKLAVVIVVYNMDMMLSRQVELVRRFSLDRNEIVIVNNCTIPLVRDSVQTISEKQGCVHILAENRHGEGSMSHAAACNQAFALIKGKYSHYAFLDHDLFPVQRFSVNEILAKGCPATPHGGVIAGVGQQKKEIIYLWPGCLFWSAADVPDEMINFMPNENLGLDTGGELYQVIRKVGMDKTVFFNERHVFLQPPDLSLAYGFYADMNDGMFMHFLNYSNWTHSPDSERRLKRLAEILEEKVR